MVNAMKKKSSFSCINALTLKLFALVTMTIDHTAYVFGCGSLYWTMRAIGRVAFPVYCFLLVEGYFHTKDLKRYAGRLAVMALISELPFGLMCGHRFPDWQHQSVMLTLLIGLGVIWCFDHRKQWSAHLTQNPTNRQIISTLLGLAVILLGCLLGDVLCVDYGSGGVLLILLFFVFRGRLLPLTLSVAYAMYSCFGMVELPGVLALIPIALYNGKRGALLKSTFGKWFFYWYYPLHIGVLVLLSAVLGAQHYAFFG